MHRIHRLFFVFVSISSLVVSPAWGEIQKGRAFDPEKSWSLVPTFGSMTEIEGSVVETSRLITRQTGISSSNIPESYSLEELGFDGPYGTFGIMIRKLWKYASFQTDITYTQPDASQRAPSDFFIGVDDVSFGGRTFENLAIPAGTSYDASLDTLLIRLRTQITPFTINPDGVAQLTPWIHLGISGVISRFEIDAGPAQRVILSENPPREYVVGGQGQGTNGGAIPEVGLGGELRLQMGRADLVVEGTYAIMQFSGSTKDIGISSRHAKLLDLDYSYAELRAYLEYPLSDAVDLVLGVSFEVSSAEALAEADDSKSLSQVLDEREKFDKEIELDYTIIQALIGLRF